MRKALSHNLLLGELASQLRFPVGQASACHLATCAVCTLSACLFSPAVPVRVYDGSITILWLMPCFAVGRQEAH